MKRSAASAAFLLLILTGLTGCLSATPPGSFFATTPPGARIRVDGHDSGFVTPCMIDLQSEGRVRVDLELEGYAPARIILASHSEIEGIPWTAGVLSPWGGLHFPVFMSAVDLFVPFRQDAGPHPQRVHVYLRPNTP